MTYIGKRILLKLETQFKGFTVLFYLYSSLRYIVSVRARNRNCSFQLLQCSYEHSEVKENKDTVH